MPGVNQHSGNTPGPAPSSAPRALRLRQPSWRDPRLWVGVALVLGSVVAGARLVAAADDTVGVWSAASDLVPGAPVAADALVRVQVSLSDDQLDDYLPVTEGVPAGVAAGRPVGAGELVPRAALVPLDEVDRTTVSLSVPTDQVPGAVRAGSVVDIWVVPEQGTGRPGAEAEKLLSEVVVVEAPEVPQGFGSVGSDRQLVVAVPAAAESGLPGLVRASSEGRIMVSGRG